MKILIILFLFTFTLAATAQITTDAKQAIPAPPADTVPAYSSLPADERAQVDRRRNMDYFSETISTFLPLSKVSFHASKRFTGDEATTQKTFILDGYVNPYVHVSSSRWFIQGSKRQWMFSLYFNPNFEVRILRDDDSKGDRSGPVRTPSYRPGGELFITNNHWFSKERQHNVAFSYKGYHHSNGQDGPEINAVNRLWGKAGYYNTYNGNFEDDFRSELYINYYGRNSGNTNFYSLKGGFSFSHDAARSLETYRLYGTHCISLFGSYVHAPRYYYRVKKAGNTMQRITNDYNIETWRLEFFLSFITNKMNTGSIYAPEPAGLKQRLNTHLTFHYRLPGFAEAGLFAEAGYYGHDTYNVYFQRSAWFVKAGISFGKFVYYRRPDDLK